MSLFKTALRTLAPLFSHAVSPAPTEAELNGYNHIVGACTHWIKISQEDDARIFQPLNEALKKIGTKESLGLAGRFGEDTIANRTNNLHLPSNEAGKSVLRKSALADIRAFCEEIIRAQADESIKQPIHEFLIHFPAATLHPDFVRPRKTKNCAQARSVNL